MASSAPKDSWVVDPLDPRAPPSDVWAALSAEERDRVVSALEALSWEDQLACERAAREAAEAKLAEALALIEKLQAKGGAS